MKTVLKISIYNYIAVEVKNLKAVFCKCSSQFWHGKFPLYPITTFFFRMWKKCYDRSFSSQNTD